MRYRITLSYEGSLFSGWQVQPNAVSVQESIQNALGTVLREPIALTGAGRTDAGVHATGYVAHFDTEALSGVDIAGFLYKINAILPAGIKVHSLSEASSGFHARFDATEREYTYFIHRRKDPFMGSYSWLCGYPLDLEKMNRAACRLLGTHDFSCFEKLGGNNTTSLCTITYAKWETYTPDHVRMMGYPAEDGDYIFFRIRANRFLRNMVRAVVGTLIEIGRGKRDEAWIDTLLAEGRRSNAGESVPGKGLFLSGIKYGSDE